MQALALIVTRVIYRGRTHVRGHIFRARWVRGIGVTPEAGGLASRPNHGLTTVVTHGGRSAFDKCGESGLRPRLEDFRPVRTTV